MHTHTQKSPTCPCYHIQWVGCAEWLGPLVTVAPLGEAHLEHTHVGTTNQESIRCACYGVEAQPCLLACRLL